MTTIDDIIYNIVKELQDKRIAENKEPVNVSLVDVLRRFNGIVKDTLNRYVENGTMTAYENLNGTPMFKIVKPKE